MATIMDSVMSSAKDDAMGASEAPEGCIMALDAGTTSVRAILFDEFGHKVAVAQRPLTMRYPHPGWVEQDPVEILSAQVACMIEVQFKSGIHSDRIHAVGITNQRETVVVWDRQTGQPIYDAVVWQCRRTADAVARIVEEGHADLIRERTGLVPDAYFSATKIAWILDNVEGAREMAENGELMCGTIDTWLIYNLTRGKVHATDYTNASRTMLFDIHRLDWDDELCELFRVPRSMLPEARPSSGSYGEVSADIMRNHPRITGVAGDQQASLFGHCCFDAGSVKNTYGTGCFMLMNTGAEPVASTNGSSRRSASPRAGAWTMRSRAPCSRLARSSSGCGMACASSTTPRRRLRLRAPCQTRAAATSSRPSRVLAHRGGARTPGASLPASRVAPTAPASCAPPASPWPTRPMTSSRPWRRTPIARSVRSTSTAEVPTTRSSCSSRQTFSA